MGFNFGHWLLWAGHAVGKAFEHAPTGIVSIAKAAINQPVQLAHELSGAVQGLGRSVVGVAHEDSGALVGVSSNLTMPLMVAGGAALVFMMTRR